MGGIRKFTYIHVYLCAYTHTFILISDTHMVFSKVLAHHILKVIQQPGEPCVISMFEINYQEVN